MPSSCLQAKVTQSRHVAHRAAKFQLQKAQKDHLKDQLKEKGKEQLITIKEAERELREIGKVARATERQLAHSKAKEM